ncbi:MAG: HdeD family acid-resistance protein [Acetatifactor sp.]
MKQFKEMKWDALMLGVLYSLLGLVSLVIPETMDQVLGYLICLVLIVGGAVSMVSYLLRDAYQNYYHNDFYHGLIGIGAGILLLVNVEWIISQIPLILGAMVFLSGGSKLQDVIDMKRMGYGKWTVMLGIAIGNLLIGVLFMVNPFDSMDLLFRLLGLGLIFSGISDCAIAVYFASKMKEYLDDLQAAGDADESNRSKIPNVKAIEVKSTEVVRKDGK